MGANIAGRDWHSDFDLDDPSYGDVFDAVADELIANCPVAHSRDGYYVVSRHDDITRVLGDWKTFSSADGIIGAVRAAEQPLFKPNETDPPEHTQLRGALTRFFTAAAVFRPDLIARMVLNRCATRTVIARESAEAMADQEPPILTARVGQRVIFAEAACTGQLAYELDPGSLAAAEIAALATEIDGLSR